MSPRSIFSRALPLLFAASVLVPASAYTQGQICADNQPTVRVKFGPDFQAGIGVAVHIDATAIDYDGEAITAFKADSSGLPPGNDAAFAVSPDNRSGSFTWTPQPGQTGTYTVRFIAANALSGTATARIFVTDTGGAPHVQAPALISIAEGSPIVFTVYAGDPDGEPIQSLTAAPLPSGASFAPSMSNTAGGFSWTPNFTQAGSWSITFTAASSSSGSATTTINVFNGNRGPVVTAPPTRTGAVGSPISFDVSAVSPDDEIIASLTTSPPPPPGVTFTPCYNGPSAIGHFRWTPTQPGTFNVTFVATTSSGLSGAATTSITVTPGGGPEPPVVSAPAAVHGLTGTPMTFTVMATAPPGATITSLNLTGPIGATLTVNATNTSGTFSWTPSSDQAGTTFAQFNAMSSNGAGGSATTAITVTGVVDATAFVDGGDRTIKLSSGKPAWCASIEIPQTSAELITNLRPETVVLRSPGAGSVDQIAIGGKTAVIGDRNNDNVADMTLCFRKEDLRLLFSNLTGRSTVQVTLEGSTVLGSLVRAPLDVEVQVGGGHAAAAISPNPLNPSGVLRFETSRAGAVRVRLFDPSGRLVREVMRGDGLPAGRHEIHVDARDASGRPLASGIYFFRIESADGGTVGRVAVLK
jgi:hypothetical protein